MGWLQHMLRFQRDCFCREGALHLTCLTAHEEPHLTVVLFGFYHIFVHPCSSLFAIVCCIFSYRFNSKLILRLRVWHLTALGPVEVTTVSSYVHTKESYRQRLQPVNIDVTSVDISTSRLTSLQ